MFNFFKKKEKPRNYGTFGAYGMEDLYDFLTEEKILNRAKELKDKPTLGTSFDDYLNKEVVKYPSGELYFFIWLLWYFPNDLKLGYELYQRRKNYSESDYPKKESLKVLWIKDRNDKDVLIERYPEEQYWKSSKRNFFWLEYHLFYFELLKNFLINYNQKILSEINLTGIHKRKGTKFFSPNFEARIIARRNYSGFILTFKSPALIQPIKFIIENNESFTFECFSKVYRVEVLKETANIFFDKIEGNEDQILNSIDFKKLMEDLVIEYLNNFDSISDRFKDDILKDPINTFLQNSLIIPSLSIEIKKQIESAIESKEGFWGELKEYY